MYTAAGLTCCCLTSKEVDNAAASSLCRLDCIMRVMCQCCLLLNNFEHLCMSHLQWHTSACHTCTVTLSPNHTPRTAWLWFGKATKGIRVQEPTNATCRVQTSPRHCTVEQPALLGSNARL
jgi:hypothetical protein